jgi:uncharacterized repeat protein (TIGR02543 family)
VKYRLARPVAPLLLIGLVSAFILGSAQAAQAATVTTTLNGISYRADDTAVAAGATVTSFGGASGAVVLPDSVLIGSTSYAVTTVGVLSLSGDTNVTSITLPNSLTTVGPGGLDNDPSLTNVTFGDSLTSLDVQALSNDNLSVVEFPASLTSVDIYVLANNPDLTTVLFEGPPPTIFSPFTDVGASLGMNSGLTVYYDVAYADPPDASGFTEPTWQGYPTGAAAGVSYDLNGHGTPIPTSYYAVGDAHARPTNPIAKGFTFDGWFSNPALTTPANFDAAITVDTTLYAKWTAHPVLATTGVAINPLTIPLAVTVVVLGALLIAFAALRRRRNRNRLTEQDEQV